MIWGRGTCIFFSINEERGKRMKFKNMIMGIWKLLIFIVYMILHYLFIKSISIEYSSKMLLICMYLVLVVLFSVIFNALKIGVLRITEIAYSEGLSMILTSIIFYFLLSVITWNINRPLIYLGVMITQILCVIVWARVGHDIYYKLNDPCKILLIYGEDPQALLNKMKKHESRFDIVEKMESKDIEKMEESSSKYGAVMLYEVESDLKQKMLSYCFENDIKVFVVPSVSDIILHDSRQSHLIDTPFYVTDNYKLTHEQEFIKRVLDLIIIVPITIIALPFMAITALCIKLEDGGPVLYKQERLTKDGKHFFVYKFRSMIVNAEKAGAQLAQKNDNRITKVGNIVRKIRFDELPQILNILKGDMSIVGPRPERPEIAEDYVKEFPEFKYRLKVKAGLTGYAQIYGKYNTTPIDKVKMDIMYIQNYSLLLDIKLIILTVKILFMPESTEGIEAGQKTANVLSGDKI